MLGLFSSGDAPKIEKIDARRAIDEVAEGNAVLIDVREEAELRATGKAVGAIHVPLGEVTEACAPGGAALPGLAEDTPIILYCGAGVRAQKACEALADLGYKRLYNLGGFGDWQAAGGPVEPFEG